MRNANLSTAMMYRTLHFCGGLLIYIAITVSAQAGDQKDFYDQVTGLIKDEQDAEAIKMLLPLAELGDDRAQLTVATILCNYARPPEQRRCKDAAVWYEKSAESGNGGAMCNLGIMLIGGEEIQQDTNRGLYLMQKATEKWECFTSLGVEYKKGEIVPQDYTLAHMYFNLAHDAYFRDGIAAKMSPDQVAEAQRLARDWVREHPKPTWEP